MCPPRPTVQDVDPLALERQVSFALAIVNRAVHAVYRPLVKPLGLTHPQYLVMLALWGHPRSSPEPSSRNLVSRTPVLVALFKTQPQQLIAQIRRALGQEQAAHRLGRPIHDAKISRNYR
jgi:hypothetical protein